MKSRQSRTEVKYVLKEIVNYPPNKEIEVKAFLENKVDRLQVENRVLAEQLSQQIRNRQTLTVLLAEQKEKYEQALQTMNKMNKPQSQQLTKMPSHQRLKYLKHSNSSRKQSFTLENELQNKKLKEKVDNLQAQMRVLRNKSEKDELTIKQLKQQLMFCKQHLKRAELQKNELQQEMEQGRNQIYEANQLLARQNKQILNMKFELQRNKQPDSLPKIDLASFYLQDLEELQQQINRILCVTVQDHEQRQQTSRQIQEVIKQVEGGWLKALNKQQY